MSFRPELDHERNFLAATNAFLEDEPWRAGLNVSRVYIPPFGKLYWRPTLVESPPDLSMRMDFAERVGHLSTEGATRSRDYMTLILGQPSRVQAVEHRTVETKRGKLIVSDTAESLIKLGIRMENKDVPGDFLTYEAFAYSSFQGIMHYGRNALIEESMRTGEMLWNGQTVFEGGRDESEIFERIVGYMDPNGTRVLPE